MKGRVLIIAGSDSGGGAGIQADIKTVTALGGFAMTAVTALTAQNTKGVQAIHGVPPEFIKRQIESVLSDLGADAIKIGMLHSAEVIEAVHEAIADYVVNVPLVVDPVMVATSGDALLENKAVNALMQKIIPLADVLTPNIPEATALSGVSWGGDEDAGRLAKMLTSLGPKAILLKGGHLEGNVVRDLLMQEGERLDVFESPRIETAHTHGTGCTLASAVACGLAQGMSLYQTVDRARRYVYEAIRTAPGYGHGHGPLNHGHAIPEFT